MRLRLVLAIAITVLFFLRRKVDFKWKVLFHPLLIAPLLGAVLGKEGFTTGVTVGVIVELLWGSNLVDYNLGFKYPILLASLTTVLAVLTANISLFFNLILVLILVFSFQESLDFLEGTNLFYFLVFIFNLITLNSTSLISRLLGIIPAQFLNDLAISGGIIPVVGMAILLAQALFPIFIRDNIWYYSYAIAIIVSSVLVLNSYYWGLVFFPIIWLGIYYLWEQSELLVIQKYLRWILAILIIGLIPLITEMASPFITSVIQYVLWIELILTITFLLRLRKLTAIEIYFMILVVGLVGANFGLLI